MLESKTPKIINSIELEKAEISLLENNIIEILIKEYALIEVIDVKKFQEAKRALNGNKKHCVLFVTPKTGIITKEARELSASLEANENAIAKAIISSNLGMRIIINFFISYNRPDVLHKAFESRQDGIDWLIKIQGQ